MSPVKTNDMSTGALFFPGQGAQSVGMATDLIADYPEARAVFGAAREILDVDFESVCRDGPPELLNSTRMSQPAIFLHSMAALEVLGTRLGATGRFGEGIPAFAAAGLSLGEYSALVFVGSVAFEDALRIVGRRGEFMQEACDATEGGMSSVMGLSAESVEETVAALQAAGQRVAVANYNSPDQTVISGTTEGIEEASAKLTDAGAKRIRPLAVAGAYHSPLMASATSKLEPYLREVTIRPPRVPFYANVSGSRVEDPEEIRDGLLQQVESSVRWKSILGTLLEEGLTEAYEVGPGKVIRGLVRTMDRSVKVAPLGTAEDLAAVSQQGSRASD